MKVEKAMLVIQSMGQSQEEIALRKVIKERDKMMNELRGLEGELRGLDRAIAIVSANDS